MSGRSFLLVAVAASVLAACASRAGRASTDAPIFHVEPSKRSLATWLDRSSPHELDRVLLDTASIAAIDQRFSEIDDGPRDLLDASIAREDVVRHDLAAAPPFLASAARAGKIVVDAAELARATERAARAHLVDELHALVAEATLRCTATRATMISPGGSAAVDKNRCSEAHAGELVRVLARAEDGWAFVRTSYAVGWVDDARAMGPALEAAAARAFRDAHDRVVVTRDKTRIDATTTLRLGTVLPIDPVARSLEIPASQGFRTAPAAGALASYPLPFTRRSVLAIALAHAGDPYGWAGYDSGLDCSRFTMDLFRVFGLELPRGSKAQVEAGSRTIALAGLEAAERVRALREASACGVVLAEMPGHVMLHLGEDGDRLDGSSSWVISALGDLRLPARPGEDAIVPVNRVEVMPLSIGAGSTKGSILMRLEKLAVFGACERASATMSAP